MLDLDGLVKLLEAGASACGEPLVRGGLHGTAAWTAGRLLGRLFGSHELAREMAGRKRRKKRKARKRVTR